MTEPLKWNDPPNMAVIDEAIALIGVGVEKYTCLALEYAVYEREESAVQYQRIKLYQSQYRQHAFRNGRPYWWDSPSTWYVIERIAALKKFKQACINAAKEKRA